MNDILKEINDSIINLDNWITENGWAGYDINDIRATPLARTLLNNRYTSYAYNLAVLIFPILSRRVFGVRPQINAKAMGLLAVAYLELYQRSKNDNYYNKSNECLKWLEQNQINGYSGACWGLPFDWQSVILFPRDTPISTTTAFCGDAFWNYYKITNERNYLSMCKSICEFLVNDLYVDYISNDKICFSYTPLDKLHVHNSNLLVAEYLIRVGKESMREDFYHYGIKALNYSLEAQNEDGSFYYFAIKDRETYNILETNLKRIDHYHTGFVLRSLHSIYQITNDSKVYDVLFKGYQFYRDNLFENETISKISPHSIYPINIHSCAESILCMSLLSDIFPDSLEYAQRSFRWTIENMQDKDGHFYYLKTRLRTDKTPYLRWGQAWMMRALTALAAQIK